jgi:hypothetical protein
MDAFSDLHFPDFYHETGARSFDFDNAPQQ